MKKALVAVLALLSCGSAIAQNSFPTVGGATVGGAVQMCLNASGIAVACTAAGALPASVALQLASGAGVTSQAAGADAVSNAFNAYFGSAFNYIYNGTTWDRLREVPAADAQAATGMLNSGGMVFNGTTWDRLRGTTLGLSVAPYGVGAVPITSSSGNQANAAATATLAANATKTTYLCGFAMTSAGSTAATIVGPTITGPISGTMTFVYTSVAGVTLANQPLQQSFTPCVPGSAVNTAIVVTLPALGAGNTNAATVAWGYQL